MADIRAAVQETAQQVRGESSQMLGQFSQGLAQQFGEAVRGMHGAGEQHMKQMLQMFMQGNMNQQSNTKQQWMP